MTYLFKNNAASTLAATCAIADLSLTVAAGQGARFPNPGAGQSFLLTIQQAASIEVVECTARVGDVLTIQRAKEGTSAQTWNIGASVTLRVTESPLNSFVQLPDGDARYAPINGPVVLTADPVLGTHAARKSYVDAADALRIVKSGDTMTGILTFAVGPVWAADPTLDNQLTRLAYVRKGVYRRGITSRGTAGFGVTLALSDFDNDQVCTINANSTFNLPALAGVPDGTRMRIYNSPASLSYITIDPNGSELIDGGLRAYLFPGESAELVALAAGWFLIGPAANSWRVMRSQTALNSATIDFVIPVGFSRYRLEMQGVRPATDNAALILRHSRDSGVSYLAGAADYTNLGIGNNNGTVASAAPTNGTSMILTPGMDNGSLTVNADVVVETCLGLNTSLTANSMITSTFLNNALGVSDHQVRHGRTNGTGEINGVRALMDAGNISVGNFVLSVRR